MAFTPQAAFELLERARLAGRLAHAYLITGAPGSGKRALAARLATLVCGPHAPSAAADPLAHPDVHTIEPESKSRVIRVEQTRGLEKALQMRASLGGQKVGVIVDADRMNASASNSFLKTLEEPPAHSLLLLLTAHPEMLLDTILSRCILVPLADPPEGELAPERRAVLEMVARFFEPGKPEPGLGEIFLLVRAFTLLLAETKAALGASIEAEQKREEALYAKTTDGQWLEEREDYFKALAEARYLQARAGLVDTLLQWWGDVLRQQHGAPRLDFPAYEAATAALAGRFPTPEVLRRIAALEGLRENFNRNVQEQLAVEVAFLGAFLGKS
jgi:DNA polymerase-3 subunit delta'